MVAVWAGVTGVTAPSYALDADAARNLLSSVFLAQSLAAVRVEIDPEFAKHTAGRDGDAIAVATHMKDEITAPMTREEATSILQSAAGAARAVSLGMIRPLSGGTRVEQIERMRRFCIDTARPLVKGIVDNHEQRHADFELILKGGR